MADIMGNCCGSGDQIQNAVQKIVEGVKKIIDGVSSNESGEGDCDVVNYTKTVTKTSLDFNISDLTLAGLTLIEGLATAFRSTSRNREHQANVLHAQREQFRAQQFETLRQQTRARRSVSVIDAVSIPVAMKLACDFVAQTERTNEDGSKTLEPAALTNVCAQVVSLIPPEEFADTKALSERVTRLVHSVVPPEHWVQVVNAMSVAITGVAAPRGSNPQPGAAPASSEAASS